MFRSSSVWDIVSDVCWYDSVKLCTCRDAGSVLVSVSVCECECVVTVLL
jgi:hypothetical protein